MHEISFVLGNDYLVLFARTVIGLLFFVAGVGKIKNWHAFTMTVRKFEILPKAGAQLVGSTLPWVEVALALTVFLGILLPWSALLAAGLLGIFIAAVSFNILRGNRNISCGCFGSHSDSYLTWSIVGRNLLLVVVALLTIGSTRFDASPTAASTIPLIAQLPIEESIATVGGASTLLGLWWFWSLLSRFWSPPNEEYPAI